MDYLIMIPLLFIIGVYGVSAYTYFKEEKEKTKKRKCHFDKYNK